jgi:hypothetical protein
LVRFRHVSAWRLHAEDRCDEATGWWQKWDLLRQVAGRLVCTGRGGADREQEGAGDVEGDKLGRWALGAVWESALKTGQRKDLGSKEEAAFERGSR